MQGIPAAGRHKLLSWLNIFATGSAPLVLRVLGGELGISSPADLKDGWINQTALFELAPSAPACSRDPFILMVWSSLCCSVCSCWPGQLFWDVTVPFRCRAHHYQGSLAKERRSVIGASMLLEKPPTKRFGCGEHVGGGQRSQDQGSGVEQLSFPGLAANSNQSDLDFMQHPCTV